MKLSKKAATLLALAAGACLFVTSAFADMALGTGYDKLKNTIKRTTAQMESGLDSYTFETLMTVKVDDRVTYESADSNKIDVANRASEHTRSSRSNGGPESSDFHSYDDVRMSAWKSGDEDRYRVIQYGKDRVEWNGFTDPFAEDGAQEIEKIFDALVGNLKDNVSVSEREEGGRYYSGSLSEAQVPALVNAVTSYQMKQMIRNRGRIDDSRLPQLVSDIYVKAVSGTAAENEAGVMESLAGDVVLSGLDADGVRHTVAIGLAFKLSDIGSTVVAPPDLTNAEFVENARSGDLHPSGLDGKHAGTYVSNIVMGRDGAFVKIGERKLVITRADEAMVTGTYSESVKPEFASEYPNPESFSFEYPADGVVESSPLSLFAYTNAQGETAYGRLSSGSVAKVYLELNVERADDGRSYRVNGAPYYDGEFIRVFE